MKHLLKLYSGDVAMLLVAFVSIALWYAGVLPLEAANSVLVACGLGEVIVLRRRHKKKG